MTIRVTINNFRKMREAHIEIAPIALIVGENENGKSSIAQAVALAAAQQPLPKSIAKKDAKALVHDGAKSGKVELARGDATSEISWPLAEFKVTGQGKPLYASEFAVGLKTVFQLTAAERVAYFIRLLTAEPTLDDLKITLPKSLDNKLADVWKQIGESGWDEAHATAKQEEAELTGQWKAATGEQRWNVSTAGDWRPQSWEPDLERAERTELEVAYAEAKKVNDDTLRAQGAADFDRKQLEAIAATLPQCEQQVKALEEELRLAEVGLRDASKRVGALPSEDGDDAMRCPECGTALALKPADDLLGASVLVKAKALTPTEREERDTLALRLKNAAARVNTLKQDVATATAKRAAAQEAHTKLQQTPDASDTAIGDTTAAQDAYARAERRLDMFNTVQKARLLFEHILTQKELVAALHQSGVRKTKLDERIKHFNETTLKPLAHTLGSEIVWFDGDLTPWRGNRPYHLLSRSARYAVRILLQLGIAQADRSELVVIDDMDEINNRSIRGGLMTMIASTGIPALVCMAKRPEENAPDLAARNAGHTYQVVDGIVQPFTPGVEAQAA